MLVNTLAKLNKSARNATSAALIIIAAIAIYRWTIPPHYNYLSAAKSYESAVNNIIDHSKIIKAQVETQKTELQKLYENSSQLESVLFSPNEAKEFFSDLQIIAEQSGCVVQSSNFIPEKAESKEKHNGIEIRSANISIVGIYKDIETFIGRLQSRTQKVWINSVKMGNLDETSSNVLCELTITIYQISDKG
jgi:Tfp pilus assembly protein PilO